jgi:UDP-N-acetylmuramate dehydrogenase
VNFPDLEHSIRTSLPELRGRLIANQRLDDLTWFRVGGPAQIVFLPEDESDLAYFLRRLPSEIAVSVIGLGSNLIVRDGGVPGIVVRLGRGFSEIVPEPNNTLWAGAAMPDVRVARAAQEASLDGLWFLRGIPGSIGGALRMNGGAYGREMRDVLLEARGIDRQGRTCVFSGPEMGFRYRGCAVPEDVIFTGALLQGTAGDSGRIASEMAAVTQAREATQPVRSRTGGSTFKNPPGAKAWELIDRAGCRGLRMGDAQVSELHCNFLINLGQATAAEIEGLGELVRERVKAVCGVELEWEIKRIGLP